MLNCFEEQSAMETSASMTGHCHIGTWKVNLEHVTLPRFLSYTLRFRSHASHFSLKHSPFLPSLSLSLTLLISLSYSLDCAHRVSVWVLGKYWASKRDSKQTWGVEWEEWSECLTNLCESYWRRQLTGPSRRSAVQWQRPKRQSWCRKTVGSHWQVADGWQFLMQLQSYHWWPELATVWRNKKPWNHYKSAFLGSAWILMKTDTWPLLPAQCQRLAPMCQDFEWSNLRLWCRRGDAHCVHAGKFGWHYYWKGFGINGLYPSLRHQTTNGHWRPLYNDSMERERGRKVLVHACHQSSWTN